MTEIVVMVQEGGPFMYVLLAGTVVMPMLAMAVVATHLLRWRLPQGLIVGVPTLLVAFGAFGTFLGAGLALEALATVNPAFVDRLASNGYAVAIHPGVLGAFVGTLGCGLLAAANGLGLLFRPGLKSDFSGLGLFLGVAYGLVTTPVLLWFSGWVATLLTLLVALGMAAGGARSPYQDDADKARCASTRVLIGYYALLGFACNALLSLWYAHGRYQAATLAEASAVARLQFLALDGLEAEVGVGLLMGAAAFLVALLQASNRFGDLDGRAWAQGVLMALAPLAALPVIGITAYRLSELGAAAVPWPALRTPVLQQVDLLPPRLDLPMLQPITRADTLQFAEQGTRWNDGAVPDDLVVGSQLNIEAGPDVALVAIMAFAAQLEGLPLCITVRSEGVLSCLPLRIATSAEGEAAFGVVDDTLPLLGLALVPADRGWVLLDGPDQIRGRGSLDEIRASLPPEPQRLRVWFPTGHTVEDIIAVQKGLTPPEGSVLTPGLIWRTDAPSAIPEATTGDASMVVEGLTKEQVREVVQRSDAQIAYCYQRTLQHRPDAQGSFNVRFTVGASGTVTSTLARDSTINDSEVERCVETRIRNMRFPPPVGGVAKVLYPFVFKPADAAP